MRRLPWALALLVALAANAQSGAGAPAGQPPAAAKTTFILFASPVSRKLLAAEPVDLKWRVNRWRDLLQERGASYTIATHAAQLALLPRGAVLIMPSAIALGDEERRVVAERLASGDSLLATGMPGTVDEQGAAVAPRFLEETFGVKAQPAPVADRKFLVVAGDTPLTYALPAGSRLWIGARDRFPTPLLSAPGAAYLSDWSRASGATGMLAFTTVGTSRRALLGWHEGVWEGQPEQYRRLAQLALDWVEGRPVAHARAWPSPYRAAMTIGVDSLWRFENIAPIAQTLAKSGVRASFHIPSSDAAANAAALQELPRAGHSVGGFGDAAEPFAGKPGNVQQARVEAMVQGFRNALGADSPAVGLRAPQGATDEATERAAASLDYLVDAGRVDSSIPVLAANQRLVLLSANASFDASSTLEAIASGLAGAASRAQLLRGYAFVGVDGAAFLPDSAMQVGLARFLDSRAKGDALWMASAADVSAWWRARQRLGVATAWDAGESVLTVDITVGEPLPHAAAVALVPPPAVGNVSIDGAGVAGATLQAGADASRSLVLTGMQPGKYRLRLRFQP